MATLHDAVGCWSQFIGTRGFNRRQKVGERDIECDNGATTVDDYAAFQYASGGLYDANPIIDGDTGFAYFKLTACLTVWLKSSPQVGCADFGAGCNPPVAGGCTVIMNSVPYGLGVVNTSAVDVAVTSSGSETNPYTGLPYIEWAGVPVVAAVELDGNVWFPLAVGLASAYNLEACKEACDTADRSLQIEVSFS